MNQPSAITPLGERRGDIFFVVIFLAFAFTSFFSDAWHALGLLTEDMFWGRANLWYGEFAGDAYFLADHQYLRIGTGISGFIYGPFYLLLSFAFLKGKNWIRPMALVYVGAMLHGMIEYISWEYWIGPAPTETMIFWAFNGPYALVPVLLGVRMWKPDPFSAS